MFFTKQYILFYCLFEKQYHVIIKFDNLFYDIYYHKELNTYLCSKITNCMNIYTEDEALIELLEVGCTNDKRYKRLPKDVIKGYIKAYNHLRAAKRIEDLFRIGSLHYERLKGDLKDFESVRCTGRWRLIFKSSTIDSSLIITDIELIEISNHYGD